MVTGKIYYTLSDEQLNAIHIRVKSYIESLVRDLYTEIPHGIFEGDISEDKMREIISDIDDPSIRDALSRKSVNNITKFAEVLTNEILRKISEDLAYEKEDRESRR